MIEFNLGVPGSGKTYRGIYALYSNFGLNKKLRDSKFVHNDIKFAYTNINEIKVKDFEKGSIKKLDWDIFYESLTTLHAYYKDKLTDNELIIKAKELDLFECLIILDECQNYLDKNDVVLIWWLSYHRHFSQQIYLISQNLALVYTKYKSFSEFFYVAKPSSLKLFKSNMIYNQFTSSRLSQVSKSGVVKIPFVKEIFETYHSGANQQSQNLIKKFVLIAVSFFALLILGLIGIKSYFTKDIAVAETQNNAKNTTFLENKTLETPINTYINTENLAALDPVEKNELKLFKFDCFSTMCYYKFEDKTTFEIPQNILKTYLTDIEDDKKYLELKNNKLMIYVLVAESKFNFIKQGVNYENKNDNFSNVLSFGK